MYQLKEVVLNLWVMTPLEITYQISCISSICIITDNSSKITVMKWPWNNFMARSHHNMRTCIKWSQHQDWHHLKDANRISLRIQATLFLLLRTSHYGWKDSSAINRHCYSSKRQSLFPITHTQPPLAPFPGNPMLSCNINTHTHTH